MNSLTGSAKMADLQKRLFEKSSPWWQAQTHLRVLVRHLANNSGIATGSEGCKRQQNMEIKFNQFFLLVKMEGYCCFYRVHFLISCLFTDIEELMDKTSATALGQTAPLNL